MTSNLSVKQTNENSNRQSQNQLNLDPFKGRTLVRSRGNTSARPVQSQNEPEPVTYANISVQYDYLDRGISQDFDEKKNESNSLNNSRGKISKIYTFCPEV